MYILFQASQQHTHCFELHSNVHTASSLTTAYISSLTAACKLFQASLRSAIRQRQQRRGPRKDLPRHRVLVALGRMHYLGQRKGLAPAQLPARVLDGNYVADNRLLGLIVHQVVLPQPQHLPPVSSCPRPARTLGYFAWRTSRSTHTLAVFCIAVPTTVPRNRCIARRPRNWPGPAAGSQRPPRRHGQPRRLP